MKSSSLLLILCFVSFTLCRDYTVEISEDFPFNSIFVTKNSAISPYEGKITYQGYGLDGCSWIFCITRNFRGAVTKIESDGNVTRLLTEGQGCMPVAASMVAGQIGSFGGSVLTNTFDWNAQGEFYLNAQLLKGNCSASLVITGSECAEQGQYGFECLPVDGFPVPPGYVDLTPSQFPSLVFAGLTSSFPSGKSTLGPLQLSLHVKSLNPDEPTQDVGSVQLMLNGIPTKNDYDFEVPLLQGKETDLTIAAARSDSDYFYSVSSTKNVSVEVVSIAVQECSNSGPYGPGCSITSRGFTSDDVGTTISFDPTIAPNCYSNFCYFSLDNPSLEVTVMAPDSLAILYKTNNFPTATDYDVSLPGNTTFVPTFFLTGDTSTFAVFSPTNGSFTIFLAPLA